MDTLHIVACVFFCLFIITSLIGQLITWLESISNDEETHITEQAKGRAPNPYLFIATIFFVITLLLEVIALILSLLKLVGWL